MLDEATKQHIDAIFAKHLAALRMFLAEEQGYARELKVAMLYAIIQEYNANGNGNDQRMEFESFVKSVKIYLDNLFASV